MNNGELVEKKRRRIYSIDEIIKLWEAFQAQPEPVCSIMKMLLICGQRSGVTRRMQWADVDLKHKIWTIPAEETKANRTHVVPISDMAVEILKDFEDQFGRSGYVFKSPTIKDQPVQWLQKASEWIQVLSGIDDFRVHDLRRTAATYMAKLGTDRTALGKVLNHKELAGDDHVTEIFDRHNCMKEKRHALGRWATYLN